MVKITNTSSMSIRFIRKVVLLLTLLASLPTSVMAQTTDRNKIIVSYVYNFAKNIRWPNEDQLDAFTIGLYQVDDPLLIDEFYRLHNQARLKNVVVRIDQMRNLQSAAAYNLIFTKTNNAATISQLQTLTNNKPILIVSENITNQRVVMINLLDNKNQQIQFEVNKANLINSNLTALPELILLGGTEIDVANLYREGQTSLLKLQNRLAAQESRLSDLQQQITAQEKTNAALTNQTQQLNNDINKLRNINTNLAQDLSILNTTIEDSKKIIEQQKVEINNSQEQKEKLIAQVAQRNRELDEKQAQLLKRQKELDAISLTISQKENELTTLNDKIIKQEQEIANQNSEIKLQQQEIEAQRSSIVELDELVRAQQVSLYYLYSLIAGGVIFVLFGIWAYRTKRSDNNRLKKRSHDLQIARDKLAVEKRKAEAANRAKSAFLSMMSHELRTPLQSIIGYTDLIIEELRTEGNDYYIDQLIRVNTNGERLLELINNTLDLAKIEAGKMNVQLTPTRMGALIDEAVNNIKPLMTKHRNQLSIAINDDSYLPSIDYEKMLHMLVNLLSNANKFTQDGTITISVNNTNDLLTLTVSDTGIGLTQEQLSAIFVRFHQANNKGKGLLKGTGLGLSITQHFCELMGGTIHAESKGESLTATDEGKGPTRNKDKATGAAFVINIPLPVKITDKKFIGIDEDDESDKISTTNT